MKIVKVITSKGRVLYGIKQGIWPFQGFRSASGDNTCLWTKRIHIFNFALCENFSDILRQFNRFKRGDHLPEKIVATINRKCKCK